MQLAGHINSMAYGRGVVVEVGEVVKVVRNSTESMTRRSEGGGECGVWRTE